MMHGAESPLEMKRRANMKHTQNKWNSAAVTLIIASSGCGTKAVKDSSENSVSLSSASLANIPNAENFLKSTQSNASLTDAAMLNDELNLSSSAPPKFSDISSHLLTYLTGDVATLAQNIDGDRNNQNWSGMKTKLGTFFEAETKCGVMEHTARIIERVKEDNAPLCLLQNIGPVGDQVYRVVSGAPIADLKSVFTPGASDKILQIGLTDRGQPHFEIVQVKATSDSGYHIVHTMCLTASGKAFHQSSVDVDFATGTMTLKSLKNGALDDREVKPASSFSMVGSLVSDSAGNFIVDTAKIRKINYAEAGQIGQLSAANQSALSISGNELIASFFAAESGLDQLNNSMSRSDKTALDVQFSGSGISDLVIFQGAGRSILSMSGTNSAGASSSNINDRTIGFNFDSNASPQYATVSSSSYVTNIGAVNFLTDPVLKQASPTAPDIASIDQSPCAAKPTTVLQFIDRPEQNGVFSAALKSCNAIPARDHRNMCDSLRNLEHGINNAMFMRKAATGSATD